MKQNISQQITTPKNYVGVKFINLATSEQITCTVTEQTNIDVLVKYFGGMKSYTIEFFEMNIQDGVFVVVPDNSEVLPVRQSIKVDDVVPSVSDTLEDAALKEYPLLNNNWFYASTSQSAFVKGIKSDAAKEYWQKNSCNTYREDEVW